MVTNDGGPAFPTQQDFTSHQGGTWNQTYEAGMSLRDYFAAAALQGWLSGPCHGNALDEYDGDDFAFKEHQSCVAASCYGYADAMLAEREKKAGSK